MAPKPHPDVKAAFVDSSTRQRLARAGALKAGELQNIDPDYFDPILEDFPIVAQHSKVHGIGATNTLFSSGDLCLFVCFLTSGLNSNNRPLCKE